MPLLQPNLILDRCPHCSVANPNLTKQNSIQTTDHAGQNLRHWYIYKCGGCGGIVTASAKTVNKEVLEIFPDFRKLSGDIPDRPRTYLEQAIASIHAPSGAVMLCASSVDAMLKHKKYTSGVLYQRLEKAVKDNLITSEMASWAHDVRLDANDERHADEVAIMPTKEDVNRTIDFVIAFAEYLFVLPSKIKRGMSKNKV